MPEIKKTATSKNASTAKSTATSASAERARKEALRAEVLSAYAKKQNYKATTEAGKQTDVLTQTETETVKRQNVYNTPFFSSNESDVPAQSEPEEIHGETQPKDVMTGDVEINGVKEAGDEGLRGKSFAEFSKENYSKQDVNPSSDFSSQNYAGFFQKQTTPTKIIKEKKYSRSPRAEKIARFFNYLFTTKEGWYYILGTLCLIFIIVLFFI